MTVQPIDPAQRRRPGRVPPHDLEAEESLLGAMMLSRNAIDAAVDRRVHAEDFYKPAHGHIFEAMMNLYAQGEAVDPTTLGRELRRLDLFDTLGGANTILRLQAGTPVSANASHYSKIVVELALLRRLIAVAGEISELGYDDSVDDVRVAIDQAEGLLFDVSDREQRSPLVMLTEAIQAEIDEQEQFYGTAGRELIGMPTGHRDLDRLLHGMKPGQLIVVGARPSMGKTAFSLGVALHGAMTTHRPTLFFTLEMTEEELRKRALAIRARIDLQKLHTATLDDRDWNDLQPAIAAMAGVPFVIADNPHCTIMDIRAQARRVKAKYRDLGLVVVDYLQLMNPLKSARAENRQVEVAEISRGLKVLARELDCPVMGLSQLNRQIEYRNDKRPMLADLRETGALENDADVVMGLFREEVYDPEAEPGAAEVIVLKHRNGPTGVAHLAFLAKSTCFADLSHREEL